METSNCLEQQFLKKKKKISWTIKNRRKLNSEDEENNMQMVATLNFSLFCIVA